MADISQITDFLDSIQVASGVSPLSDAKLASVSDPSRVAMVEEDGVIVALGVVATHPQRDGAEHWSIETVVAPSLQFAEFESMVVQQTTQLLPRGSSHSVWSSRSTLDTGLGLTGYARSRTLHRMRVNLPAADPDGSFAVVSFRDGDDDRLIAANAAAFSDHREAGSLDARELRGLRDNDWWDPDGILFHQADSQDAAFCWTKVHPDGGGEIYRIGVDSRFRGRRIGKNIVLEGFRYLHNVRGCPFGFLWVDAANEAAMRMYESIGMAVDVSITEWEPKLRQ